MVKETKVFPTKLYPKLKVQPWVVTLLQSPDNKWYISLQAASQGKEVVILECAREDYEKVINMLISAMELDRLEVREGPQCGQ